MTDPTPSLPQGLGLVAGSLPAKTSPPAAPPQDDQSVRHATTTLLQDARKQYMLRQNINRIFFHGSGHVDHDKSGDFEPEEEIEVSLEYSEKDGTEKKRKRKKKKTTAQKKRTQKSPPVETSESDDLPDIATVIAEAGKKATAKDSPTSSNLSDFGEGSVSPPPTQQPVTTTPKKVTQRKPSRSGYLNDTPIEALTGAPVQKPHRKSQTASQKKEKPTLRPIKQPPAPNNFSVPSGGEVIELTTAFSHPVLFNWTPPAPASSASTTAQGEEVCSFHTFPGLIYCLIGHGEEKTFEAIQWENGNGYTELDNAGWGEKFGPSRMCEECTTQRLSICCCEEHIIRPIAGLDIDSFDFEAAFRSLLPDDGSTEADGGPVKDLKLKHTKWCSVCPAPAFYECCTPPDASLGLHEGDKVGCGLLLCEICALKMAPALFPPRDAPPDDDDHNKNEDKNEDNKYMMTTALAAFSKMGGVGRYNVGPTRMVLPTEETDHVYDKAEYKKVINLTEDEDDDAVTIYRNYVKSAKAAQGQGQTKDEPKGKTDEGAASNPIVIPDDSDNSDDSDDSDDSPSPPRRPTKPKPKAKTPPPKSARYFSPPPSFRLEPLQIFQTNHLGNLVTAVGESSTLGALREELEHIALGRGGWNAVNIQQAPSDDGREDIVRMTPVRTPGDVNPFRLRGPGGVTKEDWEKMLKERELEKQREREKGKGKATEGAADAKKDVDVKVEKVTERKKEAAKPKPQPKEQPILRLRPTTTTQTQQPILRLRPSPTTTTLALPLQAPATLALPDLIAIATFDSINYESGARADATFLTPSGELMSRLPFLVDAPSAPAQDANQGAAAAADEDDSDEEMQPLPWNFWEH